jgi:hypothetical protein
MAEFKNFDSSVLEGHVKFREKKTVRNHFAGAKYFNRMCIIFGYFMQFCRFLYPTLNSRFLEITRAEPITPLKLLSFCLFFMFSGSGDGASFGDSPLWPIH